MRSFPTILPALVILAVPGLASAATINWVGPATGGAWTTAANWSSSTVPGATDTAVIAGSTTMGQTTAVTNVSGTVGGLTTTGNTSLAVSGTLTVASGTVTWTAGALTGGTLSLGAGATMNITTLDLSGGALTNSGTVNWNSGVIYGDADTIVRNSGTWNMTAGPTSFSYVDGTDTADFFNTGTMNVAGAGTTTDQTGYWGFHHAGVLDFTGGGTLEWENAGNTFSTFDGGGSITGNGTLLFDQSDPMQPASNLTLNGTTTIGAGATVGFGLSQVTIGTSGATLTGAGTLLWTGGHIIGTGAGNTQPALNWGSSLVVHMTGSAMKDMSSAYIVSGATVTWDAGVFGTGHTYFTNNGTFTAAGDLSINNGNYSVIENHGTFVKSTGSGSLAVSGTTFTNYGTINGASGSIVLVTSNNGQSNLLETGSTIEGSVVATCEVTLAGTSSLAAGATLEVGNDGTNAGQLDGSGTISGAGTLKLDASYVYSGPMTSITISSNLALPPSVAAPMTTTSFGIDAAGSLTFAGTTTWTGAPLEVESGTLVNTGTWAATSAGTFTKNGSGSFVTNSGNFTVDPGSGVVSFGLVVTNTGTIVVKSGTLNFSEGAQPSYIQTTGTTTLAGGILGAGDSFSLEGDAGAANAHYYGIDIQGGTLNGVGTIDTKVSNEGTIAPGTATTAGTLTITQSYTQSTGGLIDIGLGGTTAGTEFDVLAVGGEVTIGGYMTVSLLGNYVPVVGASYKVITSASATSDTGMFTTVQPPSGVTLTTTYDANDVVLDVNTVTITPADAGTGAAADAGTDGASTADSGQADAGAADAAAKDASKADASKPAKDGGSVGSGSGNGTDGGTGSPGSSGGCSATGESAPGGTWLGVVGLMIALGARRARTRRPE